MLIVERMQNLCSRFLSHYVQQKEENRVRKISIQSYIQEFLKIGISNGLPHLQLLCILYNVLTVECHAVNIEAWNRDPPSPSLSKHPLVENHLICWMIC